MSNLFERILLIYLVFALLATFFVVRENGIIVTGQSEAETEDNVNVTNVKTVTIALGAHREDNGPFGWFYNPPVITVEPQSNVTWKNEDIQVHTATSGKQPLPDGWFMTMPIPAKQSSEPITMPFRPGEYPYFCILHPWIKGTVIVK